ncbi:5842_t:CDS:2 [Paraglomus occultum]|uniref:N(6)-L-threonylcarbamoyladenine synthase n=1 Tax=Paraglomus occultum TaxID=144539 RepID=A0A9N9C4J7_9GLOM|nr:5842_t:CDS:2 [Paraglomus occultum]
MRRSGKAGVDVLRDVDIIAVTRGQGLGHCLGVGVDAAESLACEANNWSSSYGSSRSNSASLETTSLLSLSDSINSGDHTLILLTRHVNAHTILSTTVDDSIGEAFDKVTRLLNIPWLSGRSGGPGAALERYASLGNVSKYSFPIPMTKDKSQLQNSNMSFSGLKAAVKYLIEEEKLDVKNEDVWQLRFNMPLGGVARNGFVGGKENNNGEEEFSFGVDNGAMIAWAGINAV